MYTPDARRAWKAGQWNAAEGRCHPCISGIAAELDSRDHWLLVERPRGEQRRVCSLDQAEPGGRHVMMLQLMAALKTLSGLDISKFEFEMHKGNRNAKLAMGGRGRRV